MYLSKLWRHDWCSWSWSTYIWTSLVARTWLMQVSGMGLGDPLGIHSKENANRFTLGYGLCIALWHVLAEMSQYVTVILIDIYIYIIILLISGTHWHTSKHLKGIAFQWVITVTCCGPLAHLRSTLGWSLQGFACWPLRFTSRTSLSWSSTSLAAFDFTAQVFLNCRRTCLLPFAASKEASREQQSIGTFKTSAISRNSRWKLHLLQMNFDDGNYRYVINVVSLWCMWYTDFSIALAKHDNCQTAGCLKKELRAAEPDFVSLVMRVAISNTFQAEIFQHLLLRITLHLRFCNIFMTWSSCDQLLSEHWPRLAHGELGRRVGDSGGLLKTSEVHWSLASIDSCRLSS